MLFYLTSESERLLTDATIKVEMTTDKNNATGSGDNCYLLFGFSYNNIHFISNDDGRSRND